jgi:di/tricarboxylate transporter
LGFGTNFMSGVAATALFAGILIPAAAQIGWNAASMAVLLPNVAIGIIAPWAGATSATAFAFGTITLTDMLKTGAIATAVFVLVATTIHILLAPLL